MNSKLSSTLFFFFSLITSVSFAQTDAWESYTVSTAKGIDSIYFDIGLANKAPLKQFPFVVITEINFLKCDENGFNTAKDFSKIQKLNNAAATIINTTTTSEKAGAFIHRCKQLNYYYVKDTTGIREQLKNKFASDFKDYKTSINIKADAAWTFYSYFLFPKADILEELMNRRTIKALKLSKSELALPRRLTHWFYFKFEEDMNSFIAYAKTQRFIPGPRKNISDNELPFQLSISRMDKLTPDVINKVTVELRRQSKNYHGNYDGWETEIIRK
jgi:hypothetical protein